MAEEEKLVAYTLVTDKGENMASSKDFTGKGTATYPNGDVYQGDFVEGLREGQGGTYTYAQAAAAPAGEDGEGGAPS